jgi:hypothetical protein
MQESFTCVVASELRLEVEERFTRKDVWVKGIE